MSNISPAVGVGLICALLSALGTNLAFLFKHRGAVAAPGPRVPPEPAFPNVRSAL